MLLSRPVSAEPASERATPLPDDTVMRSLSRLGPAVCLAAIVALFVAQATSYWAYVNDDAFITFRYSAQLVRGNGPYYNPGEHVEGYTNLLSMLIAATAMAFGGAEAGPWVAKALGVVAGALCVVLAFLLAQRVWPRGRSQGRPVAGLLAAGLVAVSPGFALNSTSGLETTLYAACLTGGVLLALRDRGTRAGEPRSSWRRFGGWLPVSGIVCALAGLARPEGFILFATLWTARAAVLLGSGWRTFWHQARAAGLIADMLVVVLVFAAQIAFRYFAYDGELLPNTFYAKIGGFGGVDAWTYVRRGALGPVLGLAGLALGLAGLALGRARWTVAVPLLVVSLCGAGEPLWAATDWMLGWRLTAPYLPLLAPWVAVGWGLLASAPRPLARLGALLALAMLPLLWVASDDERQTLQESTMVRNLGYLTGHRALGRWLQATAQPGETVALMDIGIVGFTAIDQRILDLTGLTDRHIAKSPGGFLNKTYDPMYVLGQKPRYIVAVLSAPGRSYEKPAPGVAFHAWTAIEARILTHPEFERWYSRRRAPEPDAVWPQDLAAAIGAERVFEHAHPGVHYLLAVFRRNERTTVDD